MSTQAAPGVPVQVFPLCGSTRWWPWTGRCRVPRRRVDSGGGVLVAQGLLNELAAPPSAGEGGPGTPADVRRGVTVTGPRPGDPEDTLRLDVAPRRPHVVRRRPGRLHPHSPTRPPGRG
ncbi:hypothetical protein LV779_21535 [Streptomyces thinghirensis]|nr:hypothetical protein [Streptomyces thinghirensis]